jgi:hypothetical protein
LGTADSYFRCESLTGVSIEETGDRAFDTDKTIASIAEEVVTKFGG